MNKPQTARLLTVAASIDPIAVTELTVEAWYEALSDLDYQEARQALAEHRRTSTEHIRPAHIIELVRRQHSNAPRERAKWEADD
ncbi:hypothetical protein G7068_03220 [Leucobacter viscericola]|uniref:Uncharacterized protein n=1 Tax=Leucobacter viscericola TaxID=2714935 RepID=A0A6G7XCN7_9MICO|nr:hypothetical protein [Leucobacter viscericola]QIK62325.1 hypothetical protein G7068_03220 [Leucobacter viscericola]